MRVMVKFSKEPSVRFVSHLDVLRGMQRAIRRAGLPVAYSDGFHPHLIMTFAMALPVGASSQGEYMEMELRDPLPMEDIRTRLDAAMGMGFRALDCGLIRADAPSLMAAVCQSDWRIVVPGGDALDLANRTQALLAQHSVEVVRLSGKKAGKPAELRSGILDLSAEPAPGGAQVRALLQAGSTGNVSAALVADALGLGQDGTRFRLHRVELYTVVDGALAPLSALMARG